MPRIVPLTDATWEPLAALFREGGDPRWCYCQFWRLRSKDFAVLKVPQLRDRLHEQARSDLPPGLVALARGDDGADRAVGWVGFGPRLDFQRIVHSKVIPTIDDRPVWSIVCFAITAAFRGRGLGSALLAAAVDHARAAGAPGIEAYPIALEPGQRLSAASAYTGTLSMFERAGFRVVADNASDRTAQHRRVVVRLDLDAR
ncbi:MAG: GNAT family N-acetyltransferase [Chloroflexi bacterium]|nr:GNAT family N-acetyltransferase [Chloroflexota bacterium]